MVQWRVIKYVISSKWLVVEPNGAKFGPQGYSAYASMMCMQDTFEELRSFGAFPIFSIFNNPV